MWPRSMKFDLRTVAAAGLAVTLMSAGAVAILWPSKQEVAKTATAPETPKITEDEALVALRRVSANALQICVDSVLEGYLFQFEQDGEIKWWFTKYRSFWRSQNGTWLTTPIAANEWVQVGADTTGLKCNIKQ